jgi:hypothetical protein
MNKMNDIEIVSPQDQPLSISKMDLFMKDIDESYAIALQNKNVLSVLCSAKDMLTGFRLRGLGLAKILFSLQRDWESFEVHDVFEDVVFAELGLSPVTVDRYIATWRMVDQHKIPAELQETVLSMPMKSLIPIAKTLEQGYDISEKDWDDLASSYDEASVRAKVRGIKGKEPRKGSGMILTLFRDGSLNAIIDGGVVPVGFLNIESKDPSVVNAISRIVENAHIIVQ